MKLRIVLVDDHAIIRDGLKALLSAQPDMEIVGEAADGSEAFARVKALQPDVVVMDISMPEVNGAGATGRIKEVYPAVKVLVLSAFEDDIYVRQLMQLGASGYILKRSAATELANAIRAVANGGTYLDPFIAGKVMDHYTGRQHDGKNREVLSERESMVLRLIAQGHTNKEIANLLFLSVKTVETYKMRVREKLDLRTRADLVRYAQAQGWLTNSDSG